MFSVYRCNFLLDDFFIESCQCKLDGIEDNLDPTEDGEAGEEPHGATNDTKLGLQGHLHVPLYLVIGGCVEVDLDQL